MILIPIKEEIEFLKMYLDLERNRHKDKFDYEINTQNIDDEDVHIPPMLLQPFVENTVVHGIGNLSSGGQISILFSNSGSEMLCEITDNGVGREEAQRLKILRKGDEGSYSTEINQTRLDVLNRIEGGGYSSEIEDLKDKEGNPNGTKVIVRFPLMIQ